ncbi:T9SS type A sorting domain-containing protein, partial [Candidatus Poribacteria bacterium]|nr:T9SS type A sorting domain-containing protein [Candidatus Poribacteria bacterium]
TEEGFITNAASTITDRGGINIDDDVLLTIKFKAKELGSSMITLQEVKLSDSKSKFLTTVVNSAFINISPPWDVVLDAVIDIRDMVAVSQNLNNNQILELLTGPETELSANDINNPDVDRNGAINLEDLMLVSDHLGEAYSDVMQEQNSLIQLRMVYDRLNTKLHNSSDIQRLKTHLRKLMGMKVNPSAYRLMANYPNPFNPDTWIPYQLAQDTEVIISIHDISGRLVRRFDIGYSYAGEYITKERALYWDGCNQAGEEVSSGVYFYTIKTSDKYKETQKMVITR